MLAIPGIGYQQEASLFAASRSSLFSIHLKGRTVQVHLNKAVISVKSPVESKGVVKHLKLGQKSEFNLASSS